MSTMANLKEALVSFVKQLDGAKEKLVIVTGKPGSGKSQVLRDLAGTQRWRYVDCRDLVSVHDLYGTLPTERNTKAVETMQAVLNNYNADVLMLDRIQTLFNPELGIDALQVIKKISESKPLIVAWPGYYENQQLNFKKEHSEQIISYNVQGVQTFSLD